MIMAFEYYHPTGSICAPPCRFCGETPNNLGNLTDKDGFVDLVPMMIMREATREEYLAQMAEVSTDLPPVPVGCFYYLVSID